MKRLCEFVALAAPAGQRRLVEGKSRIGLTFPRFAAATDTLPSTRQIRHGLGTR
jgi:hypothetical protein